MDKFMSGIWPYLVPYAGFLLLVEAQGHLPAEWAPWMLPVKGVVPLALFGFFVWRGALPELRGWRPGVATIAGDVAVGLAVALIWVGPFLIFEGLPRPGPEAGFDPDTLGPSRRDLALGFRFLGFACVTPFIEELFIRSFLLRYLDVFDRDEDFRTIPIGRFTWRSFLGTVIAFTVTHLAWEWPVAFATGITYNLWLYRRKHMASLVLTHAVTNASLFAFVVLRAPVHPELWIFL